MIEHLKNLNNDKAERIFFASTSMLFPDLSKFKSDNHETVFEPIISKESDEFTMHGLKVFSAPKSILKSTWEKQQIKTFTSWCNFHLKNSSSQIESFEVDFRDGLKLIDLIESLTGDSLSTPIRNVQMKLHRIANVNIALDYLENSGCNVDSISPEEIVDGSLKMTLALVWALILHFAIKTVYFEGNKTITLKVMGSWQLEYNYTIF